MNKKVIDLTGLYPTDMLITILDKKPIQKKYYNKLLFYKDIILTLIFKRKLTYWITFPKHYYTHIKNKSGKIIVKYHTREVTKE